MPYEVVWREPNGLIKRFFGHVTSGEVLASNVQAESDFRFDNLRYAINDFRDCTGLTLSPEDITETAAIDKAASITNPNIRIAIVATHPDILAAANIYASDSFAVFPLRFFYSSMNDAELWVAQCAK